MRQALEALLMPPLGLFALVALGLVVRYLARGSRLRHAGAALAALGALGTVALSLPHVAFWLLDGLQTEAAIPPGVAEIDAEVIVILAADVDCDPPEYGPDQPGPLSLLRCRYGATLARRTGLPLIITGGVLRPDRRPVSHVLRDFVQDELATPVAWTEDASRSTRENARLTAARLSREGIRRVAVVTHAWHMPRAKAAFENAGLEVLPAPCAPHTRPSHFWRGWVPRARSMRDSYWALHEYLGGIWYRATE